jgi:hypothetical protein
MECRELTERVMDRLTGEAEASPEMEAHLARCSACREELSRLERAWETLGEDPDAEVSPTLREDTLALLEEEMIRRRIREFRPGRSLRPRRGLLQAAAIVVAVAGGYLAARLGVKGTPVSSSAGSSPVAAAAVLPDLSAQPRLSNVAYTPADAQGRIGISFDLTDRRQYVARPEDPEMARLMAYLLARNPDTPAEKSRAIQQVSESYGGGTLAEPSPEIVRALTTTLRKDTNPGVRKKAADALAGLPVTAESRAAFLEALRADSNPAVRLVAVEVLARAAREAPDARTIESLRERAVDPRENGFVRAKAASALQGINF